MNGCEFTVCLCGYITALCPEACQHTHPSALSRTQRHTGEYRLAGKPLVSTCGHTHTHTVLSKLLSKQTKKAPGLQSAYQV